MRYFPVLLASVVLLPVVGLAAGGDGDGFGDGGANDLGTTATATCPADNPNCKGEIKPKTCEGKACQAQNGTVTAVEPCTENCGEPTDQNPLIGSVITTGIHAAWSATSNASPKPKPKPKPKGSDVVTDDETGTPLPGKKVAPIDGSRVLPTTTEDAVVVHPEDYDEQGDAEVARLVNAGDTGGARQAALAALIDHPKDPKLLAYVKLTAPVKTAVEAKTLKARGADLEAGTRQFEGAGDAPMLAAALPFGAGAAAPGAQAALGGARGATALYTPATQDPRSAAIVRDAQAKIGMQDYKGAESALSRRLEAVPADRPVLTLRGALRRELGRYADSAEDAKRALALEPRDQRALHLLARDLIDLRRPKEGAAEADRALGYFANDAEAYAIRAEANAALGKHEDELADYARAASLDAAFDDLYRAARARVSGSPAGHGRSWPVWLGAVGTALLFFSFALFRKRGDSSVRMALRKEDHDALKAAAPAVGSVPQGFRVVKTLGQGGMGVVYEAVDLGLQRTVALKKLRPEIADNPRERARFLKEARTVAGLKHPNIVEIHSIHEEDGGLFLVFERVPGESLHDRLGRGPMSSTDAATLLKQVAAALDYAHGQGVVHQDLKPANVMVNGGLAKVMDFGIARRVQETLSTMSKIEVAGTPAYMSPEQEQGAVGPAADVFALGAFAYEALTGVTPFPTGAMMLKAQKMYRKPSEALPSLKPGVDAAIARALEPKPEDRWPTASSFVDALTRSLS